MFQMTRDTTIQGANRRARVLLAVGAVIGILLGAARVFSSDGLDASVLPDDAMVRVNDKTIRVEEFARAMAPLVRDKCHAITEEDRVRILNRLIDEELLVQHGSNMKLVDSDRRVRKAISVAMMQSIVSESSSEQPSEDDLRAFYKEHYSQHDVFFFAVVREQVEAAYRRRAEDEVRRDYLDWLWEEAEITLASEAPR